MPDLYRAVQYLNDVLDVKELEELDTLQNHVSEQESVIAETNKFINVFINNESQKKTQK